VLASARSGARFARVAVESTIPYARHLEEQVLPNTGRITAAAKGLLD
ncbi:MAG: pyruvate dehydrogenase, partial [Actinobacteria bacterium]|nr:pyruvate dehydrogenase [Actinomycetota bacterium]NIS29512.1 pyruvate dehydrogenase [Actinomycetota bacterium]NIT94570.1 pyruvate dehydrogenase [Actinomycetota bacterium]NIU18180.1 pyruvate dehydrogenase [Actinomycetota bacterium]NIU69693.1 pyruvate dehydrogenase [Actinomycetota bacterium]